MRCSMRGQYEMGEFGAIKTRELTVQKWHKREIEHWEEMPKVFINDFFHCPAFTVPSVANINSEDYHH